MSADVNFMSWDGAMLETEAMGEKRSRMVGCQARILSPQSTNACGVGTSVAR